MEYVVRYKQMTKVQSTSNEDDVQEVIQENREEGWLMKKDILGVVKYIKTDYKEDLEPFIIYYVDICSNGTSITFSLEKEEDQESLYNQLYTWKLGKNE